MKLNILACFGILAAAVSCRHQQNGLPADLPGSAQFHQVEFRLSNQSFEKPLAYVSISLDGKQVFFGGAHVARQHNYFRFTAATESTPSELTVETTVDHAPPEGLTSARKTKVDGKIPLKFDVSVHGTNIVVNQVKNFAPTD